MSKKALIIFGILIFCSNVANAMDMRFSVGVGYGSGYKDLTNLFFDNYEYEKTGYGKSEASDFNSFQLVFYPHLYFKNGIGIGLGLGPFMYHNYTSSVYDEDYELKVFLLPLTIDARYSFYDAHNIPLYFRLGIRYLAYSGDYIKKSIPGVVGGFGLELLKKRRVNVGLEFLYDTAELECTEYLSEDQDKTTTTMKPTNYVLSLVVTF